MWRIVLNVVAALTALHGLLTLVFAFAIFRGTPSDHLAFAAHGITFFAMALLNLVAWRAPVRPRWLSLLVHALNVGFLAFCVAFALAKPEPPLYTAAALMILLTASAVATDRKLIS